jgi:ParB family chromosome partitioning protein
MATTRSRLQQISAHVEESMGVRKGDTERQLSPLPMNRDAGRRPLRNIGRVEIDNVIADPDQPRIEFNEEALDRLTASIRDTGQLSAIRVRWSDNHQKWIIVAGERRWRAAKRAGLATVDCYFHEGDLSRSEVLQQQLIENLLREDLRPIEQANGFRALMDLNGWTAKQVGEALRVPASSVSRAIALLRLPLEIQQQVDSGQIPARSAYELSKLSDDNAQRELAQQAATGKLKHGQAAAAVRQRRGKRREQPRGTRQVFLTEDGWKITVSAGRKGTYDEIEQALEAALAEVRHRIVNNVQLF